MTILEKKLSALQKKLGSTNKSEDKKAIQDEIASIQEEIEALQVKKSEKDSLSDYDKGLLKHTAIIVIENLQYDRETGEKTSKPFKQAFDQVVFKNWLKIQYMPGSYKIIKVENMPEECGKWLKKADEVMAARKKAIEDAQKAREEAKRKLKAEQELLDF